MMANWIKLSLEGNYYWLDTVHIYKQENAFIYLEYLVKIIRKKNYSMLSFV